MPDEMTPPAPIPAPAPPAPIDYATTHTAAPKLVTVPVTKSTVIELHGPMTPRGKKELAEQVSALVADGCVVTQFGRVNGRVAAVFEKRHDWTLDEFLEELDGFARGERGASGTSTRK